MSETQTTDFGPVIDEGGETEIEESEPENEEGGDTQCDFNNDAHAEEPGAALPQAAAEGNEPSLDVADRNSSRAAEGWIQAPHASRRVNSAFNPIDVMGVSLPPTVDERTNAGATHGIDDIYELNTQQLEKAIELDMMNDGAPSGTLAGSHASSAESDGDEVAGNSSPQEGVGQREYDSGSEGGNEEQDAEHQASTSPLAKDGGARVSDLWAAPTSAHPHSRRQRETRKSLVSVEPSITPQTLASTLSHRPIPSSSLLTHPAPARRPSLGGVAAPKPATPSSLGSNDPFGYDASNSEDEGRSEDKREKAAGKAKKAKPIAAAKEKAAHRQHPEPSSSPERRINIGKKRARVESSPSPSPPPPTTANAVKTGEKLRRLSDLVKEPTPKTVERDDGKGDSSGILRKNVVGKEQSAAGSSGAEGRETVGNAAPVATSNRKRVRLEASGTSEQVRDSNTAIVSEKRRGSSVGPESLASLPSSKSQRAPVADKPSSSKVSIIAKNKNQAQHEDGGARVTDVRAQKKAKSSAVVEVEQEPAVVPNKSKRKTRKEPEVKSIVDSSKATAKRKVTPPVPAERKPSAAAAKKVQVSVPSKGKEKAPKEKVPETKVVKKSPKAKTSSPVVNVSQRPDKVSYRVTPVLPFPQVWDYLKDDGWTYKNGTGLQSFLYIPPGGCGPNRRKGAGGEEGVDYFASPDDVLAYIRKNPRLHKSVVSFVRGEKDIDVSHDIKELAEEQDICDISMQATQPQIELQAARSLAELVDMGRAKQQKRAHMVPSSPDSAVNEQGPPAKRLRSKGVFSGFNFLLSDCNKATADLVRKGGGTVLSDLRDASNHEEEVIVVTSTTASKRLKHIWGIATAKPVLHESWVEACIEREQLVEHEAYLLPAGMSSTTMRMVPHPLATNAAITAATLAGAMSPIELRQRRAPLERGPLERVTIIIDKQNLRDEAAAESWKAIITGAGGVVIDVDSVFVTPDARILVDRRHAIASQTKAKSPKARDREEVGTEWIVQSIVQRRKLSWKERVLGTAEVGGKGVMEGDYFRYVVGGKKKQERKVGQICSYDLEAKTLELTPVKAYTADEMTSIRHEEDSAGDNNGGGSSKAGGRRSQTQTTDVVSVDALEERLLVLPRDMFDGAAYKHDAKVLCLVE